jgi:hypothetical protein
MSATNGNNTATEAEAPLNRADEVKDVGEIFPHSFRVFRLPAPVTSSFHTSQDIYIYELRVETEQRNIQRLTIN